MTQPPNQQPSWWQPPSTPQWQQPPPQQQQWQQPQQWPGYPQQPTSSYGGFGAFEPAKQKRAKKPLLIAGIAIVVLAGAGVGAWQLGVFSGDVLDQQSVENGVVTVLRQNFGESDVRNVQCPAKESITTGTTFECSLTLSGQPKKVSIRVLNDQAQYEVGAPK